MAKKEKVVLTPEELQAKRERKTEKRKIFGETFVKALALMLSVVLVYSVVYIAFGPGTTIQTVVQTAGTSSNTTGGTSGGTTSGGTSSDGTSSDGTSSDGTSGDSQDSTPATAAEEEAAAAINAATAKAASAGYDWARKCVIEDVDVGNATSILNGIIHLVDDNADVTSVVGNFLGRGDKSNTIAKGADDAAKKEAMGNVNYALKATKLQASDIKNLSVDGNTYTFTLPDATDPQKDDSTALARLTNDFITQTEVSEGIADALGSFGSRLSVKSSTVVFKDIKVTAVINNGTLESFKYSYYMDVQKLELSVATGTGHGTVEGSYSNFAY